MPASPQSCPALVLNADYRPLSYFPLSLWSWQESVKAVVSDRVNVVAEYETTVCSPSFKLCLPSVISLKEYVPQVRKVAFTRFNVFLRDRFTCQYCEEEFSAQELTFDHVIPKSRGGKSKWENIVAACSPCNLRKGGRTIQESTMRPYRKPCEPNMWQLQENGRAFPPNFLHDSWGDFLYWDSELEEG